MKTYEQFAAEMSPEASLAAYNLIMDVFSEFQGMPDLICASYRETDVAHFKEVPISAEELAWLQNDLAQEED